jgi:ABC-2 type transport system ATP-binding protein
MTPALTLNGLSKRYGTVAALTDLTLDVPAGSIFGFLGPNGAGKTTALKILAGLTRATSGAATIDGVPVGVQGPIVRGSGTSPRNRVSTDG